MPPPYGRAPGRRRSARPARSPSSVHLDEHAAESARAYAAAERAKTDFLASVLEDIAANGYPSPESGVPWETARDATSPVSRTRSRVSPEHGARRSRVIMVEPALTQLTKLTASETHRLDRAIVAISVNPELGTAVPGTLLRDYANKVDGCTRWCGG